MTTKTTNHNWKHKHIYFVNEDNYTERKPNQKRSVRYIGTEAERRISKYGLANYITHCDEYIA